MNWARYLRKALDGLRQVDNEMACSPRLRSEVLRWQWQMQNQGEWYDA
jgi:hypothetical protein